jgi:hypothetical protein
MGQDKASRQKDIPPFTRVWWAPFGEPRLVGFISGLELAGSKAVGGNWNPISVISHYLSVLILLLHLVLWLCNLCFSWSA